MFKSLRKPGRALKEGKIKKTFSYIALLLICFVLVFLGVDPLPVGQGVVAYVGGEPIRLRELRNIEESIKRRYQVLLKQADEETLLRLQPMIRQEAKIKVVERYLIIQGARESGFYLSDKELRSEIQSAPVFQENGRFLYARYLGFLKSEGLSPSQFETRIRKGKLVQNWVQLFMKSLSVNNLEREKRTQKYHYKLNLKYAALPSEKVDEEKEKELESFVRLKDLKKVNSFLRKHKFDWKETGNFSPFLGQEAPIENKDLMEIVIHHLPQKGIIPRLIRQANKIYIANVVFFKKEPDIRPQDQQSENLLNYNLDKSGRLLDSWIDFQRQKIKVKLSDDI